MNFSIDDHINCYSFYQGASLSKALEESQVSLLTSAGAHLSNDEPFDVDNPKGTAAGIGDKICSDFHLFPSSSAYCLVERLQSTISRINGHPPIQSSRFSHAGQAPSIRLRNRVNA